MDGLFPTMSIDIGLKIQPDMLWKSSIIMRKSGSMPITVPRWGTAAFYPRMTHGAVGTALSHLSVLQNAYDAGHQSIWVLEDDVLVRGDPRSISNYIEKLDSLVGCDGWDILYTDGVTYFEPFTPGTVWRPDMASIDYDPLYERTDLGEDFYKIGGRCQAHSMIVRRSGIQKILEFENSHGIYLPYDIEIAFVPNMRFFNLKHNVVIGGTLANSDTISRYF
jgi:GR25 family glycosyltransferase involved in LPS biosynthesis